MKKKNEDDKNKWKKICVHKPGRINIKNDQTIQTIWRLDAIPIKIPMASFTELQQIILNFI